MNPSIKRVLGALLLIGTLGASAVLAVSADASTSPIVAPAAAASFLTPGASH